MKPLSTLAEAVHASSTMAIDSMYKNMKAQGIDVVGFGAGEPDFPTPDNIKAACIRALSENKTKYTAASGIIELKQAVCHRMKEDCGVDYTPSQVVIASGAKHIVYLTVRALVNPGDEADSPDHGGSADGSAGSVYRFRIRKKAGRRGQCLRESGGSRVR